MEHWCATLDLRIHPVVYEDLVEDSDTVIRGLVDFLDLPWDDACLSPERSERVVRTASHEQVRRPISSSAVGRSRRYAAHLEPLARALREQTPRTTEEAAA